MTIAVLPFVNMSNSEENEYFSDGITEEIINALAKIGNLKVTSRTSSFFFKNKSSNIREVAEALRVTTILEGSIRLSKDMVRITAQLIQAEEDFHFWSETWDRKLENIFEIQDEISLIIADKLREEFGHLEIQEHLVDKQTENIQAYEYSLKAKYLRNKWNPEDVRKAIALYEKALELDSKHSESHIGLADCYSFLGTTGFLPFLDSWEKTNQYTQQALHLNDNLSGVHYQLSNQAFFMGCNYNKSLQEMKKAIEINPNNAEAQQFMSFLYIIAGEKTKSKKHLDIAKALNPISEETQFFHGYYHYMIEDFEKSLELLNKCIAANDKNIPAYSVKPLCLLKLGRYDEVIPYFDQIPQEVIILGEKTGAIALTYALKKDVENTQKYQGLIEEQAKDPNGFTADSYIFMLNVVLGQFDKAFEWMDNAIKNKSSLLLLRFADPLMNDLKKDQRYLAYKNEIFNVEEAQSIGSEKKELLNASTAQKYQELVLENIKEHHPYLDSCLSLRSFAEQVKIHPNQLSWLLNERFGKNFNEFINHYRIETFKSLAKDPLNAHITIMGLAYDSGFNSKTAFNTYFKKETGLTPRQFISHQTKS